jgi:hypothetical protein
VKHSQALRRCIYFWAQREGLRRIIPLFESMAMNRAILRLGKKFQAERTKAVYRRQDHRRIIKEQLEP